MKRIIMVLVTALILFSASNLYAKQEQRLALLIGNSHYTHGGSLDNPVNDVRAMKRKLETLGFSVMKYENCSQKAMKRAMDEFGRKLKGKEVGLFFYAGHGVRVGGNNYLLPADVKLDSENDVEYDCVRADRILAKMETAGSRTNIIILDACRDNPFERGWRRGAKGGGLAFMRAPSGSLIAYSTAPGMTALDGSGKNSPYTAALLRHIGTPNITALQMFQRVRSTVERNSGSKQTPWESTSLRGDFYFTSEGGMSNFSVERGRLEKERQELEQLKLEIERERLRAERLRLEAAVAGSKPGAGTKSQMLKTASIPKSTPLNIRTSSDGRFRDNGDGTVTDNRTGLMWSKKDSYADLKRCLDWNASKAYVARLKAGGHTDWRLPTIKELKTIYEHGKSNPMGANYEDWRSQKPLHLDPIFADEAAYWYWSSEATSQFFSPDCCARSACFYRPIDNEKERTLCDYGIGVRAVRNN